MLHILLYVPGPRWQAGKPVTEQPLQAHLTYMETLSQQGRVVMGGPLLDNAGGLIILQVADLHEAQHIMEHDPAILTEVVTGSVHPWMPVITNGLQH